MTTNIANKVAYLRTSRTFPKQADPLSVELDKSYVEIAQAVNVRVIGLYSVNKASQTGENWFPTSVKQEGFRQIYTFTGTGNIAHGINLDTIGSIVRIYGSFTDGSSNWYPLPYVDVSNANNQVNVAVTSTNIVISAGAGSPPSISTGIVVLEWISDV